MKVTRIAIAIILLVVIIFSGVKIVDSLGSDKPNISINNDTGLYVNPDSFVDTSNVIITPVEKNTPAKEWKKHNEKVTATITINGLTQEPIVTVPSVKNQNEYLRKAINGEYSKEGTLFTAYDAVLGETNVTTVFGHSMKDGSMFGTLNKFKNLDYLKSNPTFKMSSLKEFYTLKIVGVADVSSDYYDSGWYYPQSNLTEEEFETFKHEVRNRSYFVIPDSFEYEAKYVILSCCDYAFEGERLIIVAKIVEDENVDTSNYKTNGVVLRANEYYETYGYTKPSDKKLTENYVKNY